MPGTTRLAMTVIRHEPALPPGTGAALPEMCAPARERILGARRSGAIARAAIRTAMHGFGARPAPPPAGRPGFARVLVIIPGHLGDVITATPALGRLRAALPDAWIVALAGPWGRDVLDRLDDVSAILECRFPAFDRSPSGIGGGRPGRAARAATRVIRAEILRRRTAAPLRGRFDAAVVLAADFAWGASIAALAGIPIRAGIATPDATPSLTHPVDAGGPVPVGAWGLMIPRPHAAALAIDVVDAALAALGVTPPEGIHPSLRFVPSPDEVEEAARAWDAAGLPPGREPAVVAIHPVPGAAVKRWAPARWAAVIDAIHARYPARVVLTGAPGDAAVTREIVAACTVTPGPADLTGRLTFGGLGAAMDRVRLVIGPDGGALHLAGARGIPTVRVFGPTDAAVWGAWTGGGPDAGAPSDVTVVRDVDGVPAVHVSSPRRCAPCHQLGLPALPSGATYPCMEAITVESVLRAIDTAWSGSVSTAVP